MSVVVGMKIREGSVLLAADRRQASQHSLEPPVSKLMHFADWTIGLVGSVTDHHLFFNGMESGFDFGDPAAYLDRVLRMKDHFSKQGKNYEVDMELLAARWDELYCGLSDGSLFPVDSSCIGCPQPGRSLLRRYFEYEMSSDRALRLTKRIYLATAASYTVVGDGLDVETTISRPGDTRMKETFYRPKRVRC